MVHRLVASLGLVFCGSISANELRIARTPIVTASLPAGTTWQAQSSENNGPWVPRGVLLAGAASPVSARLDGLPAQAAFRLVRIDGGATVIPTVSRGWHLAGSAAGAAQVWVKASGDLNKWSISSVTLPWSDGSYLRVVREPLASRGFFRAEVPATPARFGSASFYPADPASGAAGFGSMESDMPTLYRDGFIAALHPTEYHRGGAASAAAGECFELSGPAGTTTVIVGDTSPTAPAGTVEVGRSYFDIGTPAFQQLTGGSPDGYASVGCRLVPAPVTGNAKIMVLVNSGGFYVAMRAYNHRAGISKLEVRNNSDGSWVELPRSVSNTFEFVSSGGFPQVTSPTLLRLTSRFGEVVSFPPIVSMTDSLKVEGLSQFAVFPDLAPLPSWTITPVYVDSFSAIPGDSWGAAPFSGASVNPTSTGAYEGAACVRVIGLGGFNGVDFIHSGPFPRPEFGVLKFAIRSATATPATGLGISLSGTTAGGSPVTSATIQLPSLPNTWQVFQIPVETAGIPARITGFRLASLSPTAQPDVLIDSISFLQR